MRRSIQLLFVFILGALPVFAGEPHQSYISYETGDAVIVQQEDGRSIEARLNLPLYPGDQVLTQRRGRVEIRLADGNVFAIDRGAEVRFTSILDSYDGNSEGTVAQLRTGEVILQRLGSDSSALRLDTDVASYVATQDAVYGVETGGRGQDSISVYEGSVEVRTARRTGRLRSGDRATVDSDGIGAVLTISRYGMSDFQDWILHRWERGSTNAKYLDSRLSYASSDLDYYGGWVYVNSYNTYAWRPRVSVGWQPYYYGSWSYGPSGSLVWVSDEPWGWVPYHYGRWAYAGGYGWVWVPGAVYAPAWVYWAFGPSYIGWVPAGWYDCWGPYYSWAYYPYSHGYYGRGGHGGHGGGGGHGDHGGGNGGARATLGLGFYGRAHMGDVDLNHWTFVDPNTVVSHRTDRTSLATDEIRNRLKRGGDNVTVAGGTVSLTRKEWTDPVSAVGTISRRGIGSGTGREGSGGTADLTPFFRRDPELPSTVRDHVARISNGGVAPTPTTSVVSPRGASSGAASAPTDLGGTVRRGTGTPDAGTVSRIPRANAPATGATVNRPSTDTGRTGTGTVPRVTPDTPRVTPRETKDGGTVQRPTIPARDNTTVTNDNWRSPGGTVSPDTAPRIVPRNSSADRPRTTVREQGSSTPTVVPRTRTLSRGDNTPDTSAKTATPRPDTWRNRSTSDDGERVNRSAPRAGGGSSDIPRRIIDQIGGARVVPSGGSSDRGPVNRDRGTSSPRPATVDRPAPSSPPPAASRPASSPPSSSPSKSESHSSDHGSRAKIK